MEWLHYGCESDLSADFRNFGASNFHLKSPFKKCFKCFKSSFFRFGAGSGFGAAIPVVIMYKKVSLCIFFGKSLLCKRFCV